MTKRADLKLVREDQKILSESFGLGKDDFTTKNYVPSCTIGELSSVQMEEAIELARLGAFERAIARVLGVDESVFMSMLKKGKDRRRGDGGTSPERMEFAERFYAARKEHLKKNLRVINEAVGEGDWRPAAWQLERSFGFTKHDTVEVEAGPQIISLMQLAQVPLEEARSALMVESSVIIDE